MSKPRRDYHAEIEPLRMALAFADAALKTLRPTGARQSKKKVRSLRKSLQGAINNARAHAREQEEPRHGV